MKNCCPALLILLAITLQLFGQTPESGAAKGPEGVWQGTLEVGGTQLRLILTVTKSESGGYSGSPLGSDGAPYLLPAFEVQGKGWGWKATEAKATAEKRRMEIPLENDVVRFPDTP